MKSVLSRLVVGGIVVAATIGWVAVPESAATPAAAAGASAAKPAGLVSSAEVQPATRDLAAWQPSPIPSTAAAAGNSTGGAGANQPALSASAPPAVAMPASVSASLTSSALAPDAAASTTSTLPSPLSSSWFSTLGGAFGTWARALFHLPVVATVHPASTSALATTPALAPELATDAVASLAQVLDHDQLEAAFGGGLPAVRGEWHEVTFYSRLLGREDSYMIWLPPGYASTNRLYPTLYLLHGVGNAEAYGVEEWLGYALTEDLDRMLALGLIEPMIVVLPNGEQSYWINHSPDTDGTRWADFVAIDLVGNVDATFRTDARREARAIGGLSMGGHGALQLAYNHPDLFSVAGAHSPTIRPFETSPAFFGDAQWFARYDPLSLAKNNDAARRILTWIDVGASDPWRSAAQALRDVLATRQAPVQFHLLEGQHEGWYWKEYLPAYLSFYSQALHAATATANGAPVVPGGLLSSTAAVPASGALAS